MEFLSMAEKTSIHLGRLKAARAEGMPRPKTCPRYGSARLVFFLGNEILGAGG